MWQFNLGFLETQGRKIQRRSPLDNTRDFSPGCLYGCCAIATCLITHFALL
ncbi:hypothetical protein NG793_15480 [Laspinema sp. C5]|uniref:Uncharacterized protein n=2 Tax=Laspinema TaxID=2584823 RepID=A0ABT2NEH9_9CYAN|nr:MULTISPECIES: hypothetical protein [unclassified Laspinema]MCT7981112.1 hypothetical protein [Laspinema sp. D3b]MCT7995071.1 hypothetical protein [Laspinema sp. D3c]